MKSSLERELKLEPPVDFELPQLEGRRLGTRLFTSTYYDTPTRSLARAGITLRRRLENGVSRWQLKLPRAENARTEIEALGGPSIPPNELLTVGTVTFRAVYHAEGNGGVDSKTMSLPKASDKTVKVNKSATVPAKPKQKPIVEESDDEVLDVDFGQSLFAADDEVPGGAGHVTQQMPRNAADDKSKTPAKGSKPVQKPAPKPTPQPKMADSDSGGLSSSSDDGLDDFLKDLKK